MDLNNLLTGEAVQTYSGGASNGSSPCSASLAASEPEGSGAVSISVLKYGSPAFNRAFCEAMEREWSREEPIFGSSFFRR
jgi:hypothetical protein